MRPAYASPAGTANRSYGIIARVRLVSLAAALLCALVAPVASAQDRPHIIVFVADDLGIGDTGPYGQTRIRTPHLDRLAREGLRFTEAFSAAPVCAPSRCALLTGMHAGHCPIQENAFPNAALRTGDPTFADVLAGAGYRTAIFGKWGLGGELPDGTPHNAFSTPWSMGFSRSLVFLDQGVAQVHYPEWLWSDGQRIPIAANIGGARARYAHDLFIEGALAWLDEAASGGEPLLLYVPLTLPHREVHPPPEGEGEHVDPTWPATERAFASMVMRMDADVGRVLDRLDALGLTERTLVLFTSDNGPHEADGHSREFFDSNGPYRGGKRDLYEGGIRVPLVARWPAAIAAGSLTSRPTPLSDLMPTLAELAGVGAPRAIDGASFAGALRGASDDVRGPLFFASRESGASRGERPSRYAVHDGSLAYVELADGARELYDLSSDPGQAHDLARERAADVERLAAWARSADTGPPARPEPVMRLVGDVEDESPLTEEARPYVHLVHFAFADAREGEPLDPVPSALGAPAISAQAVGARGARASRLPSPLGDARRGSARFDRTRADHLVVPAHDALVLGDESFTLEAWVRLEALASGPSSSERQWLAVSRATGRPDAFTDWGVLVQAGDLAIDPARQGGPDVATGRELALRFGDPDLRGEPWMVVSRLAISDDAWHRVVVRFDALADRVSFSLDDARDEVPIQDRGHVAVRGPIILGAHHDPRGVFDEGMSGLIDELRLSRGLVPDEALLHVPSPLSRSRALTLALGDLTRGSATVTRRFRVANAGEVGARMLDVRFSAPSDARVTLDAPDAIAIADGAQSREIVLAIDPSRAGPIDARLTIEGYAHRTLTPAIGGAIELRITGRVTAGPSETSGCGCSAHTTRRPTWAVALALVCFALLVRRRSTL